MIQTMLQCFDAVGWVIWPVKIVPEMTYKVSSGTLNLCSLTHDTNNLHQHINFTCIYFIFQSDKRLHS